MTTLIIEWSAWKARYEALKPQHVRPVMAENLLAQVSEWQFGVDVWIQQLSDQQRLDLITLAFTEIDVLWTLVDPVAFAPAAYFQSDPTDDDRFHFRQRFFAVQALRSSLNRIQPTTESVETLRERLADLEYFAMMYRGWLP